MKIPKTPTLLFVVTMSFVMIKVVHGCSPKFVEDVTFANLMVSWAEAMNAENYTAASSVYNEDGVLTGPSGTYEGLEAIEGFFAYLRPLATQFDYEYDRCSSDDCTFEGQYDFGEGLGIFNFEITLVNGKILREVVTETEDVAFAKLMVSWAEAMNAENYTAAASVYTDDGVLTGPSGTYEGLEAIEGFFAYLGPIATQFDYQYLRCSSDDCTFKGQYDFGDGGDFNFEITLDEGKILLEVVTQTDAQALD